jgi:hypothetical protein
MAMTRGQGFHPPLVDEIAVIVVMKNGDRIRSPLIPGVIASDQVLGIKLHRDKAHNYEKWDVPEWLPDGFDFSQVEDVDTEYQGP